jgi:hypothetical protein
VCPLKVNRTSHQTALFVFPANQSRRIRRKKHFSRFFQYRRAARPTRSHEAARRRARERESCGAHRAARKVHPPGANVVRVCRRVQGHCEAAAARSAALLRFAPSRPQSTKVYNRHTHTRRPLYCTMCSRWTLLWAQGE